MMATRTRRVALAALLGGSLTLAGVARAQEEPWTTEDIIDERIDEDAQYALMRMMSHDDMAAHVDASAILSAVKSGDLGGVYQADRGVPAQRAQAAGSSWWQMVPAGFDATCYTAGAGAPIIVYRVGVGGIPERLDPALRGAWSSCGLAPAAPRAYRVTLHKPPPPPPPAPPDLPPPPAGGLTVLVLTTEGLPVSGANVDISHDAGGDNADTAGGGVVTFAEVPAGVVDIYVTGPTNCTDDAQQVVMGTDSMAVVSRLDCRVVTPTPPEDCNVDKYNEVFNACGKGVLLKAGKCLGTTFFDYAKCKNDWICAGKTLGKFWQCGMNEDYKKLVQQCNDQANEASHCSYPGVQN